MGRNEEYDWQQIENDYIHHGSWDKLIADYGVSKAALHNHFTEGNWQQKRLDYQASLAEEIHTKRKTKVVQEMVDFNETAETGADQVNRIARNMIIKIANKESQDTEYTPSLEELEKLIRLQRLALETKRLINNIPAPKQILDIQRSVAPAEHIDEELDSAIDELGFNPDELDIGKL